MIKDSIYFHNINEIEETSEGLLLHRFPKELRNHLSDKGKNVSLTHHGSELRFFLLKEVTITLSSTQENAEVLIYYGDFQDSSVKINGKTTIEIKQKYNQSVIESLDIKRGRFHPGVIRIMIKENIRLDQIKGEYRLPKADEMPTKRLLSYGTSITQGRVALMPDLNYPGILGNQLKADVFNYGMSGCCYIEKEMVDFILKEPYDYITLELSVNMIGDGYPKEVFKDRVAYLMDQIKRLQTNAIVTVITVLDNWRLIGIDQNRGNQNDVISYRDILLDLSSDLPNVIQVKGEEIMSFHQLSYDLIHPSNQGMIEIAYHLLKQLEKHAKIES